VRKLIFLAFFLLLHSYSLAFAEKTVTDNDGNDWNHWSKTEKILFVNGFLSGSFTVASNLIGGPTSGWLAFGSSPDCDKPSIQHGVKLWGEAISSQKELIMSGEDVNYLYWCVVAKDGASEAKKYAIPNVSGGQIVDGLDTLYADFKNRSILLTDTIYVVKKQIQGLSNSDSEHLLQFLRGGKKDYSLLTIKDESPSGYHVIYFP